MSFFVSDALKGRITEEDLVEESKSDKNASSNGVIVRALFEELTHDFTFVSLQVKNQIAEIVIEVPESYQFLSRLLNSLESVEVLASDGIIYNSKTKNFSFEFIRYNERSCYLLKIVIGE